MTKADIVDRIISATGLPDREAKELLESILSIMKGTLVSGEKIKYAGFGNFEIQHKKERIGRNPHTGDPVPIEARRIVTFKPSHVLRKAINGNNDGPDSP